ncbi:MAG TPA: DUF5985 family protein [Lysobacter sp.]|nr:DUF5985 family protein [Lysobacter sp.]
MELFLLGMLAMGFAVAALLFLRFWKVSRDRLFLFFALAFALEAINRTLYACTGASSEASTTYYLLRLLGFLLILGGILDKNLVRRRR